jgi:hypothetical protein
MRQHAEVEERRRLNPQEEEGGGGARWPAASGGGRRPRRESSKRRRGRRSEPRRDRGFGRKLLRVVFAKNLVRHLIRDGGSTSNKS